MSSSSTSSALVYVGLPLPPGTSLSWIPPSSLYCCQRSVSRISAAARNRRIAASPLVRLPLCSSGPFFAKADELLANSPTPTVAALAAVNPFFTNLRRLIEDFTPFSTSTVPLPEKTKQNATAPCVEPPPLVRIGDYDGPLKK